MSMSLQREGPDFVTCIGYSPSLIRLVVACCGLREGGVAFDLVSVDFNAAFVSLHWRC